MVVKGSRKKNVVPVEFESHEQLAALEVQCRQLQALFARATAGAERDRLRTARQIHDGLAQKLTALSLDLTLIDQAIAPKSGSAVNLDQVQKRLRGLSGLVAMTVQMARKLASELHSRTLEEFGIAAALESYAAEFQQHLGIECAFTSDPGEVRLDHRLSMGVFRIAQEALLNAARHANARRVAVRLLVRGGWLNLQVQDDGRGVTQEEIDSVDSLGLAEMRERAVQLKGELKISGIPTDGTLVVLRVPVRPASRPAQGCTSIREVC